MSLSETPEAHGQKNMKFIECSNTAAQSAEIERREVVQSNLEPGLVLLTSQDRGPVYCRDHSRRPSDLLTPLTSKEINNTPAWTLFKQRRRYEIEMRDPVWTA